MQPPALDDFKPELLVSVIIPAYACQRTLDLTLAALSLQTYPSELLEVIVVDDGSVPALELPPVRPAGCRIVRAPGGDWGPGHARCHGVSLARGEILHWLDADVIVHPDHVAAQARWQHVLPDAVTVGYKRFSAPGWETTVEQVLDRARNGTLDELFPATGTTGHDYIEQLIDSTDQLRDADHLCFQVHVGSTAALRRTLYDDAGGMAALRGSEDTEFGYRLAQAGAVFVPEPAARGWHLGPRTIDLRRAEMHRHNHPYYADRVPYPRAQRSASGRIWSVPLVVAVVPVAGASYELVKACVDRLLSGSEEDLRVLLIGDWHFLHDDRRDILADPMLDLRLLRAQYGGDPRVEFAKEPPPTAFPSPLLLNVPPSWGLGRATVARLVEELDAWQVGLLRVLTPGQDPSTAGIQLWRTAAVKRAARQQRTDETLEHAVGEVYGRRWITSEVLDITDLTALSETELAAPVRWPRADPNRRVRWLTSPTLRRWAGRVRQRARRLLHR